MTDIKVLRELDDDIWNPYRRSYGARDAEAFLSLYAPDLIRAGGPAKQVQGLAEYAALTRQWFAEMAARGDGVAIEFRFVERLAAAGLASERGVFRLTATRATGERKVFHGRFHVFARKVDGRWLIAADYDSDEGGTVTPETFAALRDDYTGDAMT